MKKIYLLSVLIFIASFAFSQNKVINNVKFEDTNSTKNTKGDWAQLDGNFVATDINDVEHDLQAYLDAGKTIIIDFSATWCGPCKTLHQSGVFDDLHNTYGPEGTGELVVLWVDVEGSSLEVLQGDNSQNFDWTVGGAWPVPIISSTSVLSPVFSELYEGYVPTVFMACPSGYYKNVTSEAWDGAASVYAQVGTCPVLGDVPVAEISGPSSDFIGNTLSFENTGVSVAPITAYTWTFEGGTPATSDVANPSVTWDVAGDFEVTLVVTNENGPSELVSASVNIIDPSSVDDYHVTFEECMDFTADFSPYNWITLDIDGIATWGWDGFDFEGEGNPMGWLAFNSTVANSDPLIAYEGNKVAVAIASNGGQNNDWLISPQLSLGTDSELNFWAKSYTSQYGLERLKVGISTTGNNPEDFTFISTDPYEELPTDYTEFNYDLSEYNGLDVYIAFQNISNDASISMIDNIDINTTLTGIDNINFKTRIYPNPANDVINIYNAESANISIFDIVGKLVMTENNITATQSINISNLTEGTYFVTINRNNSVETQKIVISK